MLNTLPSCGVLPNDTQTSATFVPTPCHAAIRSIASRTRAVASLACLLCLTFMSSLGAVQFIERGDTVTGTTSDGSPSVLIHIKGDETLPGCEREYLTAVTYPTNPPPPGTKGTFTQEVRYYPGRNTITVSSATAKQVRTTTFSIAAPNLRVIMEWTGDDLDYDLYVNNVNWRNPKTPEGNLDRDAFAGKEGPGKEVISFTSAKPGTYAIYVNYYSDHANGRSSPTKITVIIGEETIFSETKTITEFEGLGTSLAGTGKSVWNVGTVIVHGDKAGGYRVVDENWTEDLIGMRDMFFGPYSKPMVKNFMGFFPMGIFPQTDYKITALAGPKGAGNIVIGKGQSAQFYANGTVNSKGVVQKSSILGKFISSDETVGKIDDLGVFTGVKIGKTSISTYGSNQIEVYVASLDLDVDSDNDSDPIAGQKYPSRSEAEELAELPPGSDQPGLVLITNRGFEEGGYVDPTDPKQDKDRDGIVENDQDLSRGMLEVKSPINMYARHQGNDSLARLYIQIGSAWQSWPSGSSKLLSPGIYSVRFEGIKAGVLTTIIALMLDDSSSSRSYVEEKVKITVIDPHYEVDRSRDAGRLVTDQGLDLTNVNHEMRFWLNNGNNGDIDGDPEGTTVWYNEIGDDPTLRNDGDMRFIKNKRVLDNFERMKIVADGCGVEIKKDSVRLYPRWVKAPGSELRLSLFPTLSGTTDISHLIADDLAQRMVDKQRLTGADPINGTNERLLPNNDLKPFVIGDNLSYSALWCATGGPPGKGWSAGGALIREKAALGMVVQWNLNGRWRKVAWYRHLHLNLSDIRASIVHWSAGDVETTSSSFPTPVLTTISDAQPAGNRFYGVQDPDVVGTLLKNDSALLFVHGYRMQRWERREFPNCHFKRLYWQRYGGSMGMFSWPTEHWTSPTLAGLWAPQNYDRSEFQARRSGAMVLAGLLPNVPDGLNVTEEKLSIMAHSMGNVVMSEAMRASSGTVANGYFAMMSAESAGCYRYNATPIENYYPPGGLISVKPQGIGPDIYRHANPQNPRSRLTLEQFDNKAPFEPLKPTQDGPVYYSGGFTRCFTNTRTYFRLQESATGVSWMGTQNSKPDFGFSYERLRKIPVTSSLPEYSDRFSQTGYGIAPFSLWPKWPDGTTAFYWSFAPSGAEQFSRNAAVMAFVVGSPTMAVGATRSMDAVSPRYPNQECLFQESVDVFESFGVGVHSDDHSFPWNYWSAKTWNMHRHLMEKMP